MLLLQSKNLQYSNQYLLQIKISSHILQLLSEIPNNSNTELTIAKKINKWKMYCMLSSIHGMGDRI